MRIGPIILAVSVVVAFGLAGCVDESHPFQPDAKPLPSQVADYRSAADLIAIAPVTGLAGPISDDLANAMAAALGKRDVPVKIETGPDARALYSIAGRFQASTSGPGHPPAISWEVRDAQGGLVGRYDQLLPIGADPMAPALRAQLLAGTGNEAAREMIKGIEGDAAIPNEAGPIEANGNPSDGARAGPTRRNRSLVVTNIEGAPVNSGDVALRRAIEEALKVAKVNVVRERASDSLVLSAKVEVTAPDAATRHVKVVWSVDGADGKELGQVSQENDVPSRLLDQIWSEISTAVAENAADGIAAIVAQAGQPQTGQPQAGRPQKGG